MDEKLRADFPIEWEEDQYVSRREFFKFVTLASGGLAVGSISLVAWARARQGGTTINRAFVALATDVPIGGWLLFNYPKPTDLCILLQPEAGKFVAFSRRCTHLSCPVEYQPDRSRLYCPCHNGAFSLEDGHVLQGPPQRALPRVDLEVAGNQIFATGLSGS